MKREFDLETQTWVEGERPGAKLVGMSSYKIIQKVSWGELIPVREPQAEDEISFEQLRAARDLLCYDQPKLGISVNIADDGSFAARLDAAIARSRSNGEGAKVISHQPEPKAEQAKVGEAAEVSASHLRSPMLPSPLRRRI